MKMQGPAGATSISVGGETFNAGDDGLFELPDNGDYLPLLAPHGFVVVPPAEAPAPAAASTEAAPAEGETKAEAPAPAAGGRKRA